MAHLFQRVRFPAPAVDLRPAGDPGLDLVAQHVTVNQAPELLVVSDRMRPRPDKRHFAAQHVEELRQLVERRRAQEAAKRRHPRIAETRLRHLDPIVRGIHCPELENLDEVSIEPIAFLPEQHRPPARQLDTKRDQQHRHGGDGEKQRSQK